MVVMGFCLVGLMLAFGYASHRARVSETNAEVKLAAHAAFVVMVAIVILYVVRAARVWLL